MLSSAEVLDLHTKLMSSYANWESWVLPSWIVNNSLKVLKEFHGKSTLSDQSPVLIGDRLNFPKETMVKIKQTIFDAFNIAMGAAKNIDNLEEFKSTFRKTYDAALRIELYRQFLSKVVSLPLPTANQNVMDECIRCIIITMLADIKQFESAADFSEKEDRSNIELLKYKFNDYASEFGKIAEKDPDRALYSALDFEKKAGKLIRSYQIQYEHELSWGPFLKNLLVNLALIVTGVGALVSLGLLVYRAASGKHAFFDNPVLVKRSEIAAEEKLLSPEDDNPYSFFNQPLLERDVQAELEQSKELQY